MALHDKNAESRNAVLQNNTAAQDDFQTNTSPWTSWKTNHEQPLPNQLNRSVENTTVELINGYGVEIPMKQNYTFDDMKGIMTRVIATVGKIANSISENKDIEFSENCSHMEETYKRMEDTITKGLQENKQLTMKVNSIESSMVRKQKLLDDLSTINDNVLEKEEISDNVNKAQKMSLDMSIQDNKKLSEKVQALQHENEKLNVKVSMLSKFKEKCKKLKAKLSRITKEKEIVDVKYKELKNRPPEIIKESLMSMVLSIPRRIIRSIKCFFNNREYGYTSIPKQEQSCVV